METKKLNYFELVDSEGSYGIIATTLSEEEFIKLVNQYKEEDELYDNQGLIEFLNEKGYEAELVEPKQVEF